MVDPDPDVNPFNQQCYSESDRRTSSVMHQDGAQPRSVPVAPLWFKLYGGDANHARREAWMSQAFLLNLKPLQCRGRAI